MMTAVPFGFAGRYGTNVGLETSRVMVMLLTSIVFSSQVQFSDPGAGPLYRGIGFSWAFAVIAMKNKNAMNVLFMVVVCIFLANILVDKYCHRVHRNTE